MCSAAHQQIFYSADSSPNTGQGRQWGFSLTCPQKEGGWEEEISAVCSFIQSSCALHGGPKYFKVVPDTKLWKYPGLKCGILLFTPNARGAAWTGFWERKEKESGDALGGDEHYTPTQPYTNES